MQRNVDALTDETFDLCIIGGGITGAGAALDAASRGWRVALIDKGDFASGTSSVSSKLVHGGLRYLEHGHFGLVREALIERGRLLRNAPHLVEPLPFLLPFYVGQRVAPWKWRLGLALYDFLAGTENIARSRPLSVSRLHAISPTLQQTDLLGGVQYFDARMDDARLCLAVIRTAAKHGAVVTNYVEAIGFDKVNETLTTLHAHDKLQAKALAIRARTFLNATGPWADALTRLAGDQAGPLLQPTKGAHLIAPDRGHRFAHLLLHPRDHRVFFVIPWNNRTLIGTTDTHIDANTGPDNLAVTADDTAYLLDAYNQFFSPGLETTDILGSFVGLRPLIRSKSGEPSDLTREFRLQRAASGLFTSLGGKYTTYRHMAETIIDGIGKSLGKRRRCKTAELRLAGTPIDDDWQTFLARTVLQFETEFAIAPDTSRHLIQRYGTDALAVVQRATQLTAGLQRVHPDEPDLLGERVWQAEEEMAIHADDFLLRRSRIGMVRKVDFSP